MQRMDDNLFEACSFISNNFGISFDEAEIIVGKIIGTELIQANKEIKIYVTKNVKTPIHIAQVKIPSLNERIRMYIEKEVMRNDKRRSVEIMASSSSDVCK